MSAVADEAAALARAAEQWAALRGVGLDQAVRQAERAVLAALSAVVAASPPPPGDES